MSNSQLGHKEATASVKNSPLPAIRYCLYARKSMEAEERQAMSIDSQVKEMQTIAERDNLYVVITKTEAHSAKDSGQRPVFSEIINDIRAGTYNAILTWNPDRLSRNAGDLGLLVDLMDQGHLKEIRTYGQIFSNSPNDKFLLMILCSQAKLENDNRGINVQRGLRTRVEMGLFPSMAPIGYLNPKEVNRLGQKDIDPERAPIVKQMYEKVAYEQYSCHDILRWLQKINFRSPNNKLLNLSTVQLILHRTFYYGQFEYPKGSGNWYKGKHTPIITKKLYDLTQGQIKRYYRSGNRKSIPNSFAFLRLMRCGACGAGITAEDKHKTLKNGDVVTYRYYMCTHGRDRWCRELFINEADVITGILKIFDKIDIDLIGTRAQLEEEIEKWYRFHAFVSGEPVPERSAERKEVDLREYAKAIFEDGSTEERRAMLKNLKSRLILKNKRIYLDTAPESEIKPSQLPEDNTRLVIRKGKRLRRRWIPPEENPEEYLY